MSVSADLAGFKDAQRRLRENFGEAVTFHFPAVDTYPPGTPIDPETNKPYDPVIEPLTETAATTVVNCTVVFKAITRGSANGRAISTAIGWDETADVMLIADIDDRAKIDGAQEFTLRDGTWMVHATIEDGIGEVQRYLVYGRKR